MTTTTSSTRDLPVPLVQTPPPDRVPGVWFDEAAVDRVVRFLLKLRHTKGRWADLPIELDPWQLEYIIRPIFGWKNANGFRIVRTAWIELPRKNTKSTTASGLALHGLCADGEAGAEVYAAAGEKDQARIVFDPARIMVEKSPALSKRLEPMRNVISYPKTNSTFRVLSSDAKLKHGFNVHRAIIDEVHIHRTRDLIPNPPLVTSAGSSHTRSVKMRSPRGSRTSSPEPS